VSLRGQIEKKSKVVCSKHPELFCPIFEESFLDPSYTSKDGLSLIKRPQEIFLVYGLEEEEKKTDHFASQYTKTPMAKAGRIEGPSSGSGA